MTLHLTIENHTSLPDGGPLGIAVAGKRGIDIGRDQYLDWSLPDPERVISGKHAEIRYREGSYWIHDVSRNGVYLNRNPQRIQAAHRLKDGDRIQIGQYIIVARIDGEAEPEAAPGLAAVEPGDYWKPSGDAPPPIPSRDLKPRAHARPVKPDFVDWAVDVDSGVSPAGEGMPLARTPAPRSAPDDLAWAVVSPPPPPPAAPPIPTPRRPAAEAAPEGVWTDRDTPPVPPVPASPTWEAPLPGEPPPGRQAPRRDAPDPSGRAGTTPERIEAAESVATNFMAAEFMQRFAKGLGIAPETLAWQDPGDLAEDAGLLIRHASESLKQLLAARAESKRATRATNQTMIQALDNNPLKFAPTVDDALRIMLGRPSSGYLDARRAFEAGFRDLRTHQIKTYSAMQNAVRLLLEELDPDAIAASDEGDRGLGGLLGSRKARLWDHYATRWDALTSPHEDGIVDAFMIFFSDCYDRGR